jgi:excisionase family DNA binding protein
VQNLQVVYLTPAEAASLLRIHRSNVYRLIEAGEIPAIRVGNQWRIPREKLLAMLDVGSAEEAGS